MWKVSTILLPTDFTPHAQHGVERGADLARTFGASVHLLHVVDISGPPASLSPEVGFAFPHNESGAYEKLADIKRGIEGEVEVAVVIGNPAEEIVRYAEEKSLDMICMATHGRTGLARMFLGSTTEKVVRSAHCPVVSLHAPDPA